MNGAVHRMGMCVNLCVGLVLGAARGEATLLDGVVAQVGDEIVLLSEVRERVSREHAAGARRSTLVGGSSLELDREIEAMTDLAIDEILMKKELSKRGFAVTPQELDAAVDRMMEQNGLDEISFARALSSKGFTPLTHRAWLQRQLVHAKFAQVVAAGVRASDMDAPLKAELVHVSFPVVGDPGSGDDRASERSAREFARRVNSGEHFASVAAAARSRHPDTVVTHLGEVALAGLIPEFEQAVRSARVGEAAGPFRVGTAGWCVLFVQRWATGERAAAALSASAVDRAVGRALSNLRRETYVQKHKIARLAGVDM
ncbi:MAG: SurA N-terminal domain-containing protein [Myxococcota bacterium]